MSPDFRWLVALDEAGPEPSRDLVGGKAWSLWRMRSLGLRVPPAFVVTTDACAAYFAAAEPGRLPDGLTEELAAGIALLEKQSGRTFGAGPRPLLVSVRSGAAISMPGMMDTILDLGCTDEVVAALAAECGDPEFAADVHRRFCGFYGRLVLGSTEDELEELPDVAAVRAAISAETGASVPDDPWAQLHAAVRAVFTSSRSRRAVAYRRHYGIPGDLGTAVTVQAMVYGNLDEASGTGVLFTRNPSDGARAPYGEYLPRGQGEDVVSGRVTPEPLEHLARAAPDVHAELLRAAGRLDADGRDAQDIEFTVQAGTLYLLQSRPAKRTARAAIRIAVALVEEGAITEAEAVRRVTADQVRTVLRPVLAPDGDFGAVLAAMGTPASPGVACGEGVATAAEAMEEPGAVLLRPSTSPEDIQGMIAAVAVVTEMGGATSHAAVVSRALDTPCVVGCGRGTIDALTGQLITVDGDTGRIWVGELPTVAVDETEDEDLRRLTSWAQAQCPVTVLTAADGAPAPVFDSDEIPADELTGDLPAIPPGTRTVAGGLFTTADGVRAALAAGVEAIVCPRRLPVLLDAIAFAERKP
jgi:pyruvate,orthophosphate dikinase